MNVTNVLRIGAIALVASILMISLGQTTQTFAEEKKTEKKSTAVNDIELVAVFHFGQKVETIKTFALFDTMSSGFDRSKPLNFKLEGIVGSDRPLLYRTVDMTFKHGKNFQDNFSEFNVDVIFQNGEKKHRQFTYTSCQIKNYNMFTEYDKDKNYNGNSKWAYVDKFEFECRGFQLGNPAYDRMSDALEVVEAGTLPLSPQVEPMKEKEIASPIAQLKSGVQPDNVECKVGLQKAMKPSSNIPVCVKPDTLKSLLQRGWR